MVGPVRGREGLLGIADGFLLQGRSGSAHAVRAEVVEKSPELVSKPFIWVKSSLESTNDRSIHRGRFPN
jgi:hypothetical protein